MSEKLQLLVISDLHATTKQVENYSSYTRLVFETDGTSHFGSSFIKYAKELGKEIDVLVCAGDIANRADQPSFKAGWEFITEIQKELNIQNILCVPGNHDHQSRKDASIFDPKHSLQFTQPSFPFNCNVKNTHFWAWHWCCSNEDSRFNAISLNTSAYHGYGDGEYKHGRVAQDVISQIEKFINSDLFIKKPVNLLICHHHPQKMGYIDQDEDFEAMYGGDTLLNILNKSEKGPWFIIHGHKHYANISYAPSQGETNRPVIFSSGSVSAQLYHKVLEKTSNQFYIIEFELGECKTQEKLIGTVETHESLMGERWGKSQSTNLPANCGFGGTGILELSRDIASLISNDNHYLSKKELAIFDNRMKYLMPYDFNSLVSKLKDNGLEVEINNNVIIQVGKQNV